jgi:hypothetical protein
VAINNFFTAAVTNGPLTAPSTAGGNGAYAYGGSTAGTSGSKLPGGQG